MHKKMSRIERLIAEKCPEGVEYRALLETPSHPKTSFCTAPLLYKGCIDICEKEQKDMRSPHPDPANESRWNRTSQREWALTQSGVERGWGFLVIYGGYGEITKKFLGVTSSENSYA